MKYTLFFLLLLNHFLKAQPEAELAILSAGQVFCPKTLATATYSLPSWQGNIKKYSQSIFVLDSAGNPQATDLHPSIEETYNEQKQLQSQLIRFQDENRSEQRQYFYNKQGYLIRIKIEKGKPAQTCWLRLKYNLKEQSCSLVYTNEKKQPIQRESASYDPHHKKITTHTHERLDPTTQTWSYNQRRYSYNMTGRLLEEREYQSLDKLSARTAYTYDSQGEKKQVLQEFYLADGLLSVSHDFQYSLDELKYQKTQKEVTCYRRGNAKEAGDCSTQATVYQYDSSMKTLLSLREGRGTETQITARDAAGNWTKRIDKSNMGGDLLIERQFEYLP